MLKYYMKTTAQKWYLLYSTRVLPRKLPFRNGNGDTVSILLHSDLYFSNSPLTTFSL